MAKSTPAHIAAANRYRKKAYTFLQVTFRADDPTPARIETAARQLNVSRSKYMYDAICQRLDDDDIPAPDEHE